MSIVRTNVLSKTYRLGLNHRREIEALRGVSLTVEAGEIFGLLGPNGAGKTTFVKLLVSIIFPTGGVGYLFDHPLGDVNVRQRIGYLPENQRFPSQATGLETLVFLGSFHGLHGTVLKDRSVELLRLVGLKGWEHVKILKYSKGMLRRLGVAQALLHEPELLILDEPTDGVDPIGRKEIRDILSEVRRRGTTIFLNSHLLSEVETLCDRVAILDKGEVVKIASIKDLTPTTGEFDIQTEGIIPSEVFDQLQCTLTDSRNEATVLRIKAASSSELNMMIDVLRQRGVLIRSIKPVQSSFEDAFINLVKQDARHE